MSNWTLAILNTFQVKQKVNWEHMKIEQISQLNKDSLNWIVQLSIVQLASVQLSHVQ